MMPRHGGHRSAELRRRLYEILEQGPVGDRASVVVDRLIVALIVLNLVAVTLESVPAFADRYGFWFDLVEHL